MVRVNFRRPATGATVTVNVPHTSDLESLSKVRRRIARAFNATVESISAEQDIVIYDDYKIPGNPLCTFDHIPDGATLQVIFECIDEPLPLRSDYLNTYLWEYEGADIHGPQVCMFQICHNMHIITIS